MSGRADEHRTFLELDEPVPAEVAVGSTVERKVRWSCAHGCDLDSGMISLVANGASLATCEHGRLVFTSPQEVGE